MKEISLLDISASVSENFIAQHKCNTQQQARKKIFIVHKEPTTQHTPA